MNKTWYKQQLLSYSPILFIALSVMILTTVICVSEVFKQEAEKASRVSMQVVTDTMQTTLKEIEYHVVEELNINERIQHFFEPAGAASTSFVLYDASVELKTWLRANSFIDSAYLYRAEDGLVLTPGLTDKLSTFPDRAFIEDAYARPSDQERRWSPVRLYRESELDHGKPVISLYKNALLPFGNEGLFVVNVRVDSLVGLAQRMINHDITQLEIWSDGVRIDSPQADAAGSGILKGNTIVTDHQSGYTGWRLVSGLKAWPVLGMSSSLTVLWLAIGIATFAGSGILLVFVTKRNYRPLEQIVERVQTIHTPAAAPGSRQNEFSFIEKALDKLIDQTNLYEKRHLEDRAIRKKQLFQELITGEKTGTVQEWQESLSGFGMNPADEGYTAAVIEIDHYPDVQKQYDARERKLVRFELGQVLGELAEQNGQQMWSEWVTGRRMAVLHQSGGQENRFLDVLEAFRSWAAEQPGLTVTAGLGSSVNDLAEAHRSWEEAQLALNYKMSFGTNQLIAYSSLVLQQDEEEDYRWFQIIQELVQQFRLAQPQWEQELERLFEHLARHPYQDHQITGIMKRLTHLFKREFGDFAGEGKEAWNGQFYPQLLAVLDMAETVEELRRGFHQVLTGWYEVYAAGRESTRYAAIIPEIRSFIEAHYGNPDLSLHYLSDKFMVNSRYFSQRFKDEFGIKFVDYLVGLRMNHAKRMLAETDDMVQQIALQVGYTHAISFGRTFKKVVGVTPGDYRRVMQAQTQPG